VIWKRERRVGVGVLPYIGSKLLVLSAIAALQCALLAGLVYAGLGLWAYGFSPLALMGVSVLVGWVGMALGLLVSASFRSSEAAVGTLPLLLIPQIAFAGLLVPVRDMGAAAKALTWLMIQRYGFEAAIKSGEALATPSRVPGQWNRTPITGPLYELGLKPAGADDMGLSMAALCAIIAGFGVAFLLVATLSVWRKDRGGT
jgi:hypothetical protein